MPEKNDESTVAHANWARRIVRNSKILKFSHCTANFELRQRVWELDGRLHLWQVYPEANERNVYFETCDDGRWARIDQRKDRETGK